MAKKTGAEKIDAQLRERSLRYEECFSTEAGRYVLEDLEYIFQNMQLTQSNDSTEIIRRAAQYDVIVQIKTMLRISDMAKVQMAQGGTA